MNVVLKLLLAIAAEPLETLESWVVELFSNVRKGPQIKPQFTVEGPIWKAGKLYRLEAVKDVHILDLTWTLPCLHQEYLKKSEDYLAHLLGHGKIYHCIQCRNLCMSISVSMCVSVCESEEGSVDMFDS